MRLRLIFPLYSIHHEPFRPTGFRSILVRWIPIFITIRKSPFLLTIHYIQSYVTNFLVFNYFLTFNDHFLNFYYFLIDFLDFLIMMHLLKDNSFLILNFQRSPLGFNYFINLMRLLKDLIFKNYFIFLHLYVIVKDLLIFDHFLLQIDFFIVVL